MSSIKSSSSLGEPNGKDGTNDGTIIKMGYVKKLKTMKKKFFVIHGDAAENSTSTARIEYYDSEKKWRNHQTPKRSILLKMCFNINRRVDTKHKHVIGLYTNEDCFCLVFDTEEEMSDWLKALLSLQQGDDVVDGESPKPTFEHVWQVTVAKRGLGSLRNILGAHLLCLTDKTLSLVKTNQNEKSEKYEFSLANIRRCGDMESFFYMEVGRSSCTGAGDLWMQTEDTNIAQNMHAAILHAMSNNSAKEELGPRSRTRSSSANEASKPISMLIRRQTHAGSAKFGNFYSTEDATQSTVAGVKPAATCCDQPASPAITHTHAHSNPGTTNAGRERCDSMPSRARTTSEGHHAPPVHTARTGHLVPGHGRPYSMYTRCISHSPPVGSSPVSPASGACSTDSAGSSLSVDDEHNWVDNESIIFGVGRYGHSLTPDEPIIFEENLEPEGDDKLNDYMPMDRSGSQLASLSLPIQTVKPVIKYSPNLSSSGFKSGSPSASYLDMYSPCSSSPLDTVTGYMAMSPGQGDVTRYGRSASSASHSRASSLAEDGYVPMAPGPNDDGYVDMDPAPSDQFGLGEISPGNSSCSIASGTPSTDLRFSEYPLEKVSSYFTPSEEDETSERPTRAYSVGSRPGKPHTELLSQPDNSRVRAFSVGSRAVQLASRRAAPSAAPPASKSSSAPLLSHSWSGSPTLRPPHAPMDDLMEMDFTKNTSKSVKNRSNNLRIREPVQDRLLSVPLNNLSLSPNTLNNLSSSPKTMATDMSGYMEMTPGQVCEQNQLSPPTVLPSSGPYVEMKPGVCSDLARGYSASPPRLARTLLSSSPKSSFLPVCASPPTRAMPVRKSTVVGNAPYVDNTGQVHATEAYMDMRGPQPQHFPTTTLATHHAPTFPVRKPTSPIQEEYMEMNWKQVKQESNQANRSAPVDLPQPKSPYVDMSWGSQERALSSEEYMNMSNEGRRRRRGSRKDKQRFSSQPIAIQSNQASKPGSSASTSPVLTLAEIMAGRRKVSSETPPKIPPGFLPLSASPNSSPYSSLRRSRTRKQPRRQSSETLATPTGSTTGIFPFSLNSPGSPMKPLPGAKSSEDYDYDRKCPVDASSGTVCISYPYPEGSCGSNPVTPDSSSSSEQPTPVNAEFVDITKAVDTSDYVNYSPARRVPQQTLTEGDEFGDYAIMRPVASIPACRRISTPANGLANNTDKQKKHSLAALTTTPVKQAAILPQASFRPITVNPTIPSEGSSSPKIVSSVAAFNKASSLFNRQLSSASASSTESAKSQEVSVKCTAVSRQLSNSSVKSASAGGDDGAYESLSTGVSPVPSQASRPGSVSCDRELHYASLDLATETEEGARSPRNFKAQNSLTESTPSPNPGENDTFTYAEIDFVKSESLKNSSTAANRKPCQ